MAELSELIDGISRELRRDVLFLAFGEDADYDLLESQVDEITTWLDEQGVGWKIVENFDPDNAGIVWFEGGPSCLYFDVAPESEFANVLTDRFCKLDGSPQIPGLLLKTLSLAIALENAKRDDPEYWDSIV